MNGVDQEVARRVDEAIQEAGLSYAAVAQSMGVTPAAAWNWAKGKNTLSLDRIIELARILHRPPSFFAFGELPDKQHYEQARGEELKAAGLIDLPECYVTDAPKLITRRTWTLSQVFINRASRSAESECFLFEMKGQASGHFAPGDYLIIDKALPQKPEDIEAGNYLLFAPYVPEVVHVTVGYKDGVIFTIRQGQAHCDVPAESVTLLGRVVGTVKKLSGENIMGD